MSRLLLTAMFLAATGSLSMAQQGAKILGTVTDNTGAAVAGAAVIVTNVETNLSASLTTNGEGLYTSPPSLIPGSYRVEVEHAGFKKAIRSGLTLQIDQRAEVNFTLELGAVGDSIQITGDAPLVNTEDATIGKVIENKRVQELPINGRSAFALVSLTPGVRQNAGPTQSGFVDRGTNLSAFSINGGPSAFNYLLVDGVVAISSYFPDLNANLAVDAVREFKVQSGTMSSEYGFTAGGVINVATKSGTNALHGAVYEFFRNDGLDARNTFSVVKPPLRYNQYGLALGGPVVIPKLYDGRNRTFFFGNWEQYNYLTSSNPIISLPTAAQRGGDFSQLLDATGRQIPIYDPATTAANPNGSGFIRQQFPGNIIPASRLDPVSKNFLQFYPLPNRTSDNALTNSNNYIGAVGEKRDMQQYTTRVDHRFSERDSLFARYTYFRQFFNNGNSSPYPDPAVRVRNDNFETRNMVLGETHTFSPTVLNDFHMGVGRQYFPFQAFSFGGNYPQKLGLPSIVPSFAVPAVNNGLSGFNTGTIGERGALTWQVTDTLTIVRGAHSFKVGAEYRLLFGNNFQTSQPSGSFTFSQGLTGNPLAQSGTGSAFATFLLGAVGSSSVTTHIGESEKGYSLSGYVQDDWRALPRLTLNLGLRYDYQQPPYERNNGLTNFNPNAIDSKSGLLGRTEFAGQDFDRSPFSPDYTNFAPRVGFAFDVTGKSRTVIRGGYGIFYPSIFNTLDFGNPQGFASTSTSYTSSNGNLPAYQFQIGFPSAPILPQGRALGSSAFLGQSVTIDQKNQSTPMSQQWTLSFQKQLPGSWVVDASYAGNHGTHLIAGNYDLNQLDPKYLSLGTALQNNVLNPYAGRVPGALGSATITQLQSLRPYPYYQNINVRNPHLGNSIYHAAYLTVEKRYAQGLTFLASYTKAKLISDSAATPINFGAVEQVTTVGYQNSTNRRAERSLDPTDVAQRLVLSGVYELPLGKGKRFDLQGRLLNSVAGGWQVNSITTIQGGEPLIIRGASNLLADRPNSTGKSAAIDNPTRTRWFDTSAFVNPPNYTYGNVGRVLPDVRTPGVINVDLSLIKNNYVTERINLQLRAEAFNVANHVNLGLPNVSFSPGPDGQNVSSTFGTINNARSSRSVQFAAKVIF